MIPEPSERWLSTLRQHPLFAGLTGEQTAAVLDQGDCVRLARDEILVREGDPSTHFFVLLDGRLEIMRRYQAGEAVVATYEAGAFFGEVPLVLDVPYLAGARILQESVVYRLPRGGFWQLLGACPEVTARILRATAARLQHLEGINQQQGVLTSLGTLAAGLAHELNNPAAAVQRAAGELATVLPASYEVSRQLHQHFPDDGWPELLRLFRQARQPAAATAAAGFVPDALALSDREESLTSWMEARGVEEAWKYAPALAAARLDAPDLAAVAGAWPPAALAPALAWIEGQLTAQSLLDQLDTGTGRIAELIDAIGSYSASVPGGGAEAAPGPVDLHAGLERALVILRHKLPAGQVHREYDQTLPRLHGRESELVQVWTNLLDNAVDAAGAHGRVWVRTRREDHQGVVEISDDGPGIAPEHLQRIFEPFFTTKEAGAGTGLGLVICQRIVAERHGGEIEVDSRPGRTTFTVRLALGSRKEVFSGGLTRAAQAASPFGPWPGVDEGSAAPGPASAPSATPPPAAAAGRGPHAAGGGGPGDTSSDEAIADLRVVPLFAGLPAATLAAAARRAEAVSLPPGHALYQAGDQSDGFYALIAGQLRVTRQYGAQEVVLATIDPGQFFGEIPLLLEVPQGAAAWARQDSRLRRFSPPDFWWLLQSDPGLAGEIVRTMARRLRNFESYGAQRGRWEFLGAISAALARELRPPVAQARRAVGPLRAGVERLQVCACELAGQLSAPHWQELSREVDAVLGPFSALLEAPPPPAAGGENDLTTWLPPEETVAPGAGAAGGGPDPGAPRAQVLAQAGVTAAHLERWRHRLTGAAGWPEVVSWIEARAVIRARLAEVARSAHRIAELVRAVKAYSFLDQAPWQEVDVRDGLESTLAVLAGRLRGVTLRRAYDPDLPRIWAAGSELNQVWTHLLARAAEQGPEIGVRARRDEPGWIAVEIVDRGPAPTPEAQAQLFRLSLEPPTLGGNTGLEMVVCHGIVVDRHRGTMHFEAQDGNNRIVVRLPRRAGPPGGAAPGAGGPGAGSGG